MSNAENTTRMTEPRPKTRMIVEATPTRLAIIIKQTFPGMSMSEAADAGNRMRQVGIERDSMLMLETWA